MIEWHSLTIETYEQAHDMLQQYRQDMPQYGACDSETTGLHIIKDRPFLFQFGWLTQDWQHGYTYAVDIERHKELALEVIKAWNRKLAPRMIKLFGHNIKFDMHMCENIDIPYEADNVSDTMIYIRYAHDALTPEHGGPPLGLKDYCAQYITAKARTHEIELNAQKSAMAREYNQALRKLAGKEWSKIQVIFDDALLGYEALPAHLKIIYDKWVNECLPLWLRDRIDGLIEPDNIPYNKLNRAIVIRYAHNDIILTLSIVAKLTPVLTARQNWKAVEYDERVIRPFYEQERTGFKMDTAYIENCRKRMREYILQQREVLKNLAQCEIKIGQHALLKKILNESFLIPCDSTRKQELARILANLKHTHPDHPGIQFIEIVQELRSLEKWYSVYVLRFQKQLKKDTRIYTQINQVGTVSGRVTSDFQQFPREGVRALSGEVLYNPRQAVLVPGGDYDSLLYIDYSQIELRLQAMYTILVQSPEPNLCRAYMPFNCIDRNGEQFDFTKVEHIKRYKERDWFLLEKPNELWHPLDVHAATTIFAFDVQPDDPEFKHYRSKGKTLNFAKNYGGGRKVTENMFPEYTDEQINKIDAAYYKAFPGVKAYHDYCYNLMSYQSYGTNLFGVRYYNVSGHNMINMLIQGSGAFLLKIKIREMWDYAKANHIRSRFQMNIHDENTWEKHKDDSLDVFRKFKKIMEDWPESLVPIIAEMSISTTNWAEKKEIT